MREIYLVKKLSQLFLMLGISSMVVGPTMSEPTVPITVVLSLSNQQVMLGEPIVVKYDIANCDSKDVSVDLNDGKNSWEDTPTSWFTVQAVDGNGLLTDAQTAVSHFYNGAYSTGKTLGSRASLNDCFVVNSQSLIRHAGNYDLVIHVRLPYATDQKGGNKFSQDYHLPLTVTADDGAHLTATADSLYREYFKESNSKNKEVLLQSLFALPEAKAMPFWSTLVVRPDFTDTELVAYYLASQKSPEAAGLLASMSVSHSDPAPVLRRLIDVYRHSNAKIQQAIDKVYQDQGRKLPPPPPLRLD